MGTTVSRLFSNYTGMLAKQLTHATKDGNYIHQKQKEIVQDFPEDTITGAIEGHKKYNETIKKNFHGMY